MNEDDKWTLPSSDQIRKMSRKALRDRIRMFIEHAERRTANTRVGRVEAIIRAQYLTQELARRTQNRQTAAIIIMTAFMALAMGARLLGL
jgi:hypothetical protein